MYVTPLPDTSKDRPQVVLITGAAQGIGAEIARSFLSQERRCFVAFVDCNQNVGLEQERKLGKMAKFYPCDLSDRSQVEALANQLRADFGTIDVIIHNAKSPAKEQDLLLNLEREWDQTFKVMLKHPILLNHLLLESLKTSKNPSILYIGSTNSQFVSQQPLSYHVVKGSLLQTVRYLACEYSRHRVRVNLLNPGIVDIPGRERKNPQLFQQVVESVIPLQRTALAREVGAFCLFIASDAAQYLTGASLDLDGGEHLKDHFHLMMSRCVNVADASSGGR
jgi:3-oxoacyl-[acyl-carrier protein] reductase